jgi:hypothetical protein
MKDTNLPTGTLKTYNMYLTRVVPVTVQIYRPSTSTDEYELVAEETIIPTATGAIEVIIMVLEIIISFHNTAVKGVSNDSRDDSFCLLFKPTSSVQMHT